MPALIWAIGGIVLVVAESVSGEFVLLMLGVAALATAAASAFGVPLGFDVAVFAAFALALVALARPALQRRFGVADTVNTGTRGLLGTHGEVVEAITTETGTVRLNGALWSARSLHDDDVTAGTPVLVVEISGATAVVTPDPGPSRPAT